MPAPSSKMRIRTFEAEFSSVKSIGVPSRPVKSPKSVSSSYLSRRNRLTHYAARNFIRALLEEDPSRRMSLTDALQHPWLAQHSPFHKDEDEALKKAAAAAAAAAAANGNGNPFGHESASQERPLQRRSDVLAHAAMEGNVLPEPSWEMISYAARDGRTTLGAAQQQKGQNKRVHADLSVLPEESVEDANMNPPAALVGDENSSDAPRRSGRRSKVPRRS